jgi:hypothetical protein
MRARRYGRVRLHELVGLLGKLYYQHCHKNTRIARTTSQQPKLSMSRNPLFARTDTREETETTTTIETKANANAAKQK